MRNALLILSLFVLFIAIVQNYGGLSGIREYVQSLDLNPTQEEEVPRDKHTAESQRVVYEESVITEVIESSLPSVVTIGIETTRSTGDQLQLDPFNPFGPFRRIPGREVEIERNIGSGFIVSEDGLIITNKHVVSENDATYNVLTNDGDTHQVTDVYQDTLNDLALIKIDADGLQPLQLGDSSDLKLGQITIAIGTPLGEFPNTVTSGIVSGLGRGITAGSPYESFVEQLNNVIQTDAAISPGNSGGPLLNSSGEVIGVNTAVSAQGENIGFAIPVNVVKDLITNFEARGGSFERPFIGIRYHMIDRETAIMNDVPEGAYVIEVVSGSPAEEAGLQEEDIITEFDGRRVQGDTEQSIAGLVAQKKVGDQVSLEVWREGDVSTIQLTLSAAP